MVHPADVGYSHISILPRMEACLLKPQLPFTR